MGLIPFKVRWATDSTRSDFKDISARPESKPIEIEGKTPCVLAIHGFTGVPGEVALVCEAAAELGLRARAPLLPGHGTCAYDLARLGYADWLSAARQVFDEERAKGPVILVGLSLGSLLATELLLSAPGAVLGLGLLSNAFELQQPHPGLSLSAVRYLRIPDFFQPKAGPDLGDPVARSTHVTYDAQPITAAISVQLAGLRLRKELHRVHRPTLIVHGARDRVCPVKNAWQVAQELGTSDVRVVILPRSHHVITRDIERTLLKEELVRFFRRVS